jgi:hypothetical protein
MFKSGDIVDVWFGKGRGAKWWNGGVVESVVDRKVNVKFVQVLYGRSWAKSRGFDMKCVR